MFCLITPLCFDTVKIKSIGVVIACCTLRQSNVLHRQYKVTRTVQCTIVVCCFVHFWAYKLYFIKYLPLTQHSVLPALLFIASLVPPAQTPDSVAQCQQKQCFSAQISTPHKCLTLCLTLSGLWLWGGWAGDRHTLCVCVCVGAAIELRWLLQS